MPISVPVLVDGDRRTVLHGDPLGTLTSEDLADYAELARKDQVAAEYQTQVGVPLAVLGTPEPSFPTFLARQAALEDEIADRAQAIVDEANARTLAINEAKTDLLGSASAFADTLGEIEALINADQTAGAALAIVVAGKLTAAANLADLADATAARGNLGLGSAATYAVGVGSGQIPVLSSGGILARSAIPSQTMYEDETNLIVSQAIGTVPLAIKGAAGQTASLQEWRDSAGGVLDLVTSAGWIGVATAAAPITYLSVGAGTLAPTQTVPGYNGILVRHTTNSGQISLLGSSQQMGMMLDSGGKGYLGTWSNHPLVLRSNNADAVTIDTGQRVGIGMTPGSTQQLAVQVGGAAVVGLTVKAAVSQSANLTEWQNSGGGVIAGINSAGTMLANSALYAATSSATSYGVLANATAVGHVPVIARGAASQTANLQEWQDSAGAAVASVRWDGLIRALHFDGNAGSGTYMTPITSAEMRFTSRAAAQVGVVVKGAASQSANLTEWQDSAGTVLASVSPAGRLRTTTHVERVAGTGSYISFSDHGTALSIITRAAAEIPLIVKGAASQTADFQQWLKSDNTVLLKITNEGHINSGSNTSHLMGGTGTTIHNRMTAQYAGQIPLVIKGFASQTANLQEWQKSDGTVYASFGSTGLLNIPANGVTTGPGSSSNAASNAFHALATSSVVLAVRGASSQTADLQQWQNSAGSLLGYMSAGGDLQASRLRATLGAQGGGLVAVQGASDVLGISVRAVASQTSDLMQFQDNAGTVLARVSNVGAFVGGTVMYMDTPSGYFRGAGLTNYGNTDAYVRTDSGSISVVQRTAASVGLIVKGAASQTAPLTSWQDSGGNSLALVDRNGRIGSAPSNGLAIYASGTALPATVYAETASTTSVGVIVKGLASQSGDLQQWQDSAGTAQAKIRSNGRLVLGSDLNARLNATASGGAAEIVSAFQGAASQTADLTQWMNNSSTVLAGVNSAGAIYTGNRLTAGNAGSSSLATFFLAALSAGEVGQIIRAAASQTANLLQFQDSAGTVVARVFPSGTIGSNGRLVLGDPAATLPNQLVVANNQSAATTVAVIRGAASQSGNLTEWQANDGTIVSRITAAGALVVNSGNSPNALINPNNAASIGLVVKGAASATADLVQWQNSAATILGGISSGGRLFINSANPFSGTLDVKGTSAAAPVIVARAAASVTANVQEWQNSGGTLMSNVDNNGNLWVRGTNDGAASFLIASPGASNTNGYTFMGHSGSTGAWFSDQALGEGVIGMLGGPSGTEATKRLRLGPVVTPTAPAPLSLGSGDTVRAIVKGITSQSADLQQWQDDLGVRLASVTPSGKHKWAATNEQTTVGVSGTASAPPLLPVKYLKVMASDGTVLVVPAYAAA